MVYDKIQTENRFSNLSTSERQEIQMKKAKLIGMLDEVLCRVSSRAAQGKNRKTEDTIIGASKKYHLGQLKTKIAKLRTQLLESPKVPCTVSSQAAQDKNSKTKDIIIGASKKYHLRQLKTNIAKLRTQLLEPPKGCYHGDHDEGVKFINIEEEE
ncbi:hypothetical protein AAZX31_06G192700 [Glycine max]